MIMVTVQLPNGKTDSYTTQVGGTVLAFVDGAASVDTLPEGVARFLTLNGYKVAAGKPAKAPAKSEAAAVEAKPEAPAKADDAEAKPKPKAKRTKPADK